MGCSLEHRVPQKEWGQGMSLQYQGSQKGLQPRAYGTYGQGAGVVWAAQGKFSGRGGLFQCLSMTP